MEKRGLPLKNFWVRSFLSFESFLPNFKLKKHIIASTNKELLEYGKKGLTIGEFWIRSFLHFESFLPNFKFRKHIIAGTNKELLE